MAISMREGFHSIWHAFSRPFVLLANLRTEKHSWRRYLITVGIQAVVTVALAMVFVGDELDDEVSSNRLLRWWALWSGTLLGAQWVTLALTREFHVPLSRALSAIAGIAPEDDDIKPRVRLDWRWLWRKMGKRVRGLLVLLPGVVFLIPFSLLASLVRVGGVLISVFFFAWSSYWWCAFTAGRSARGWRDEAANVLPSPVQWWFVRTERTYFFRWFGRFSVWATRRDAAPAVAMEKQPLTFIGLGIARALTAVPVIHLFFRVPVDVAAAEALERQSLSTLPVVDVPQ